MIEQLLQVVVAGLIVGVIYALLASGLNLIFGVFDVLNIAHGEFLFVGAYVSFYLWSGLGLHPLLTIPLSAAVTFAAGLLLQYALVERVLHHSIIVSLILLFGVSIATQGLGLYVFGVNDKSIFYYQGSVDVLGLFLLSKARGIVVLIAAPILVAMHLYLSRTKLGIATKATAQNAQIAEACGINVRRVRMLTMGLAAALAGVAGSLLVLVFPVNPQSGLHFAVIAFVVAVVGGLGSFYGSIAAGLFLGAAEAIMSFYTDAQISVGFAFLFLVVILVVRPSGLAGLRSA